MVCLSIVLGIFLPGILWASWICGLVSDIYFGKVLGCYCFKYLLFFSSFPSDTSISHTSYFLSLSHSPWISCFLVGWLVFSVLVLFAFQFFEDSIDIPSSSEILSSARSSLLISPSKAFLLQYFFFISSIYFWFFHRISISLLTLAICPCMLSTLSTKSLSLLILAV